MLERETESRSAFREQAVLKVLRPAAEALHQIEAVMRVLSCK